MSHPGTLCPSCGQRYFSAVHRCLVSLPDNVIKNIGTYLPIPDLARFAASSKRVRGALPEAQAVSATLRLNKYSNKGGTGKATAYGEAVVTRCLFVSDPNYRNWDEMSESEKDRYRPGFSSKGATPDFIFLGRPADCFTPGITDRAPDKCLAALKSAGTLYTSAQSKWSNYGPGSIAIANISSYPAEVTTQEVINIVLLSKKKGDDLHGCRFFLVRGSVITEVLFH